MRIIKVSWTILSAWAAGKKQEALTMLAGNYMNPTQPMIDGKNAHANVSTKKLRLTHEFKEDTIFEDMTGDKNTWKNRFQITLDEWLQFSGIVDAYVPSTQTIIDLKTGKRKALEIDPMQLFLYGYAYHKMGIPAKRGIIQKLSKKGDRALDYFVYAITEKRIAQAKDYIFTIASEIYSELG